jgi:hypothetical protein
METLIEFQKVSNNSTPLTFNEIIHHEPRIALIISGIKPSCTMKERWKQYESAKNTLARFVGWSAENPVLRGRQAHDTVCQTLARHLRI